MYDIYLLQLGFHSVAVVGKLVQNYERDSYIQKEKQYTEQYIKQYTKYRVDKRESQLEKQENKHRVIKSISRVIRK